MAQVEIVVGGGEVTLHCSGLIGHERLGQACTFELSIVTNEPLDLDELLGKGCVLRLAGEFDERLVPGFVTRISAVATSQQGSARRYSATVRSGLALLELRRDTKVFQHKTVPAIVREVLERCGYAGDRVREQLVQPHAEREYVVQYAETCAAFITRLCEEEGLYFRFETTDGPEVFVLEDQSGAAADAPCSLTVVDDALRVTATIAVDCRVSHRRRPGKVTLRDHWYETPAVKLEGVATGGNDVEQSTEVYEAPGGFRTPGDATARAAQRLESLRADASTVTFRTNALALAPGMIVTLELDAAYVGAARPEGRLFIVGLSHRWVDGGGYALVAQAIPADVPFRLPRITPRPVVHGVHPARVTGPAGQEIHTDAQGRVHVRFPWDREGPADDKSSLPVRTMQPNMPGSMALPRVGWEVLVGFEEGDADRPLVLGRTYNAKQPPPQGLPVNKTVTSLRTYSSPGGGAQNVIQMDDAAGRQHLTIGAGFAKKVDVANNLMTQTVKNESLLIKGSQSRTVGANEDVSIAQALTVGVGSQSATVGATQRIYVKGNMAISVGSESVLVGGALLEKVGDPVSGAKQLAQAAALEGAGALGVAGAFAAAGYQVGRGYAEGGWQGALTAGAGVLGSLVPGGDAIVAAVTSPPPPAPWNEEAHAGGEQAAGGGAAGATDESAAAGPGPGHRGTWVDGAMLELIGAKYAVMTPGSIGWTTLGASTFLIGGSHNTKTISADTKVLGISTEVEAARTVKTKAGMARKVRGALTTQIAGTLDVKAGGEHGIKSDASVKVKVGGGMKVEGSSIVFKCGGSEIVVSGGGISIVADEIKITGQSKQSGKATHT
ncbi:type VI secretion system Vgr family protein [Sorangium sp. So ce385]|uniref:type VI secretion system Vgr family protein n=1 Tax=Sorangium sp. So ce385 TaxID=3133308 RepID=UPI003F5CAD2E